MKLFKEKVVATIKEKNDINLEKIDSPEMPKKIITEILPGNTKLCSIGTCQCATLSAKKPRIQSKKSLVERYLPGFIY